MDIFVSRPNWVAPEFNEGLTGFLAFLDSHDIKPRTLGSTDYPTESPLKSVIRMMDECQGAIILGYPKITVNQGSIKGIQKNDFLLPTEWNQIEAVLSHIKELPLLIFHHTGISGGVFDRGAISDKFLYEKDFTKPNWFLSTDIAGVLKQWKAFIQMTAKSKSTLPQDIKIDVSKTTPVQSVTVPLSTPKLDKDVASVLIYLFNQDTIAGRTLTSITQQFKCNKQAARYYTDVLEEEAFVKESRSTYVGLYFDLTAKGRQYVMTNKRSS